ncbi:four-carbon acid sugar kinase family protein [Elioraea sp.]|uniref:four-carbon acid sugar kinase family protein n=1 Tax=Elioraea sp. TaxID=2185103 RepID=UPI003F6EB231
MTGLRLLADDLTGALDAAAPFAASRGAIAVRWLAADDAPGEADWCGGDAAISTSSRDLTAPEAVRRVCRLAPGLAVGLPAFKKIDSLLRGNTATEIVAAHRAGGFTTTLVAPAFPAQGRFVRAGRLCIAGGGARHGVDLAVLLAAAGAERGITVCDTLAADDLNSLVAAHRRDEGVLWAGSSGLARAFAAAVPISAVPQAARVLIVVGSLHAVTRREVAAIAAATPESVISDDGGRPVGEIAAAVARRLESERPLLIDAAVEGARMRALFVALARIACPELVVVVGGDTLLRLLGALGCRRVAVRGEVAVGLPLSTLVDGAWAGVPLISKSGAFEDGGLLRRLLGLAERIGA